MATVYDGGDGELLVTRRRQRRRRTMVTFVYDTGVNLLANLLAAAIIYLAAESTGLVKGNAVVTITAVSLVLGMAGFALLSVSGSALKENDNRRHYAALVAGLVLLALALAAAGTTEFRRTGDLAFLLSPLLPLGMAIAMTRECFDFRRTGRRMYRRQRNRAAPSETGPNGFDHDAGTD